MQLSQNPSICLPTGEIFRTLVLLLLALFLTQPSVHAEIDRLHLGAQFDASGSQLTFRVYSSRATRIELFLYSRPTGGDEAARRTRP
jgi:isoamylase